MTTRASFVYTCLCGLPTFSRLESALKLGIHTVHEQDADLVDHVRLCAASNQLGSQLWEYHGTLQHVKTIG